MSWKREILSDVKLSAELVEEGTIELGPVVSHQYLRDSKLTSNGFLDESLHFELSNLSQGLDFSPLSEIIKYYNCELFVSSGY